MNSRAVHISRVIRADKSDMRIREVRDGDMTPEMGAEAMKELEEIAASPFHWSDGRKAEAAIARIRSMKP